MGSYEYENFIKPLIGKSLIFLFIFLLKFTVILVAFPIFSLSEQLKVILFFSF